MSAFPPLVFWSLRMISPEKYLISPWQTTVDLGGYGFRDSLHPGAAGEEEEYGDAHSDRCCFDERCKRIHIIFAKSGGCGFPFFFFFLRGSLALLSMLLDCAEVKERNIYQLHLLEEKLMSGEGVVRIPLPTAPTETLFL